MTETKAQQEFPYCHDPYKPLIEEPGIDVGIASEEDDIYFWLSVAVDKWGFSSTPLHYCPICGRRLDEGE